MVHTFYSSYIIANCWFFFLPLSNQSIVAVAKSGEPLDEEKEAFDDPEKGELNAKPAVPPPSGDSTKNTPDKKPEAETKTKPEAEDNKEEKKSNGGHTPV